MRLITELIKHAMPAIRSMGRAEIAEAHAKGLPGIYMIGDRIVREYPDGHVEEVRRDA